MFHLNNNSLTDPKLAGQEEREIYNQVQLKFKQIEAALDVDESSEFLSLGSMDISSTESNDIVQKIRNHQDTALYPQFISDLKKIIESYRGEDSEFKDILNLFNNFLDEPELFYAQMNAPTVFLELLEVLINPVIIDQKNTNLCGIAATLSLLLHVDKRYFVQIALDLVMKGESENSCLKPHPESIKNEKNIIQGLMSAIKNNYTRMGYTNHSLPFFEPIRGATRPKEIVTILKDLGFMKIDEFIIINNKVNQTELSTFQRAMLGGIYDKDHKYFSSRQDNLQHLKACLENSEVAIMLINPLLILDLLPGRTAESFASPLEKLNIESTHYIFLKKLEIDNTHNKISFQFETCGKEYTHTTSIDDFLKYYRGAITVDPKISKHLDFGRTPEV